jgi:hypothetical protein
MTTTTPAVPGDISENVSETQAKRSRGRPPLIDPVLSVFWQELNPGARSRRSLLNTYYFMRAVGILIGGESGETRRTEFQWLIDESKPTIQSARRRIMIELGRIEEAEALLTIARHICELKPKSAAAITMIRRWRNGGRKPVNLDAFTQELVRLCDDYLVRHPDMTLQQLEIVLLDTLKRVQGAIQKHTESPPER